MPSLTRLIRIHGSDTPLPEALTLKAGSLTMQYHHGAVRSLFKNDTEILRMIYAAVRDPHWITVEPEISNEKLSHHDSGFKLSFDARYIHKNIDFRAGFSIEADTDHHCIFTMEGKAYSAFSKNRIGFCVLHPVESCAGKECEILQPDGTKSKLVFPINISPHQPFGNIASMRWNINEMEHATLQFFGDVFETEDQRNWTDASYKTYSTPLDIPFPVEIQKGTVIKQRIEFNINDGRTPFSDGVTIIHPVTKGSHPITIFRVNTAQPLPIPPIGTSISSRPQPLSPSEARLLKKIRFSHLRSELHLFDTSFEKQYQRLLHETKLLDLPAELCLVFGKEPEQWIQHFFARYRQEPVKIKSLLLLSQHERTTSRELLYNMVPTIRKKFPNVPVGAGTNGNFAQLNRNRPDPTVIDFISFSIHPQEHASDDQTLFENMEGQKYTILTGREFEGNKPVFVSPVTLQRRFNANISNYEIPSDKDSMPPQIDVRQMSLAGAAWTVGSLKYILESGVSSVTYYETVGERGLMMGEFATRWTDHFHAVAGVNFPLFHVFRMLLEDAGYRIVSSQSSKPLAVDGFTVVNDDYGMLFLSNMTGMRQKMEISGVSELQTRLTMNEKNFHQITRPEFKASSLLENTDPVIHLLPFETRFIRFLIKAPLGVTSL